MTIPRPWGCPKCGHLEGRVLTSGRDEDGNKIRLRRCTQCDGRWVTEEHPLAPGVTFSQRAFSAAEAQRQRRAKHTRTCRYCGGRYQLGSWPNHVTVSRKHLAWKAKRAQEIHRFKVEDARWRYHNDPVYRASQIQNAAKRKRRKAA